LSFAICINGSNVFLLYEIEKSVGKTICLGSMYFALSGTTIAVHFTFVMMFSAVLPIADEFIPEVPLVPVTIMSIFFSTTCFLMELIMELLSTIVKKVCFSLAGILSFIHCKVCLNFSFVVLAG